MEAFFESFITFVDAAKNGTDGFGSIEAGLLFGCFILILFLIKKRVDQRREKDHYKKITSNPRPGKPQTMEEINREILKEFEAFKNKPDQDKQV